MTRITTITRYAFVETTRVVETTDTDPPPAVEAGAEQEFTEVRALGIRRAAPVQLAQLRLVAGGRR